MKSMLLLVSIACLMTSALPVAAPVPTATTAGPIAGAMTREVLRRAAAAEPIGGEAGQQSGKLADANWSRVRKLAPGTEIIVTVKGSPVTEWYFVAANESDLTVLHLTDPSLPVAARDILRDMAAIHPDYFAVADKRGSFVNGAVRVAPDGVFVADRKVADLAQVVEIIAQSAVAEVKTRQRGRGVWGHLGPLGGFFVGGMAGGVTGAFACHCDTGGFLVGMMVGGITGGVYGFRAANRETENVIYGAP